MINFNKFHQSLDLLADDSVHIEIKNGDIFCSPQAVPQKIDQETVKIALDYLCSHEQDLKKGDIAKLEAIKTRFSKISDAPNLQELEKTIPLLIDKAKDNHPLTSQIRSDKPVGIIVQVANSPRNAEQLLSHLWKVQSHYPRFQLGNDLCIYDISKGILPQNTDPAKVKDALDLMLEKYRYLETDESTKPLFEVLRSQIDWLTHELKPLQMIQMAILVEKGNEENGALFNSAEIAVKQKVPVVMTKHLFECHPSKFTALFSSCDVYLQNPGDLMVLLPKGKKPLEEGFNEHNLTLCKDPNSQTIVSSTLKFDQQLDALLIKETQDIKFSRFIFLQGHGLSKLNKKSGHIAGLTHSEFQEGLKTLKNNEVAFLVIFSCYLAGVNRDDLSLPDGSISCPMVIQGVTDEITYVDAHDSFSILAAAQKRMTNPSFPNRLRPLTQKDMKMILNRDKSNNDYKFILRWLSYQFPANKGEIPKHLYIAEGQGQLLSIDRLLKEQLKERLKRQLNKKNVQTKSAIEEDWVIEDRSTNRQDYLVSEPVFPAKLLVHNVNRIPALVSAGGNAHHIIKEIDALMPFEGFLEATANAPIRGITFDKNLKDESGEATKVFAIAKFSCEFEGKPAHLENVVIKVSKNKTECCFRIAGEKDFRLITFKRKGLHFNQLKEHEPIPNWEISNFRKVSEDEALFKIYESFIESEPDKKNANWDAEPLFYESLTDH